VPTHEAIAAVGDDDGDVEVLLSKPEPVAMPVAETVNGDLGLHPYLAPYIRIETLHPFVEFIDGIPYRRRAIMAPIDLASTATAANAPPNADERERLLAESEARTVQERGHAPMTLRAATRSATCAFLFALADKNQSEQLVVLAPTGHVRPTMLVNGVLPVEEAVSETALGDDEFIITELKSLDPAALKETAAANLSAVRRGDSNGVAAAAAATAAAASSSSQAPKKKAAPKATLAESCPVCGWQKAKSQSILIRHVNACLLRQTGDDDGAVATTATAAADAGDET
jgi:hypothetical protein